MTNKPLKVVRTPPWSSLPAYVRLKYGAKSLLARLNTARFVVRKRQGALFLIDKTNLIDRHLQERGRWEGDQLAMLRQLLKSCHRPGEAATFIDIGAHGGYYAIQLAGLRVFDRILCIEADTHNAGQLQANLFLNGLTRAIEVIQAAAVDRACTLSLMPGRAGNRGQSSIVDVGTDDTFEVAGLTIDSLGLGEGGLVVAKIDVEGAELNVLAGMEVVLAENRCILQVESFGDNVNMLSKHLAERGFEWLASIDDDHFFTKATLVPARVT